jgi:hypothetical protein
VLKFCKIFFTYFPDNSKIIIQIGFSVIFVDSL